MANLVTLSTLITRVRQRANIEGAAAFITDAEITDHLNVSLATEIYELIRLAAIGDQYYRKSITFTTTSGTRTYPLSTVGASDLVSLISVDAYLGSNVGDTAPRLNCRRFMEEERNLYASLPLGWAIGYWVLYSLEGQSIAFQPIPNTAYAIGLNYVPTSPQLVNTTDTWDDINGWSEIAVLDAAAKCLVKDGQLDVATYLDQRRLGMYERFKAAIGQRHAGEPERTHMLDRMQWGDGWENGNWGV